LSTTRADFNINSSGGSVSATDSFESCTFYGEPKVPTISLSIDRASFEATVGGTDDDGMDIALNGSNAFDISFTAVTCDADWQTNTLNLSDTTAQTFVTLTGSVRSPLLTSADGGDASSDTQRCIGTLAFEVDVPAGKTPDSPGSAYVFTGPNLTFSASFADE